MGRFGRALSIGSSPSEAAASEPMPSECTEGDRGTISMSFGSATASALLLETKLGAALFGLRPGWDTLFDFDGGVLLMPSPGSSAFPLNKGCEDISRMKFWWLGVGVLDGRQLDGRVLEARDPVDEIHNSGLLSPSLFLATPGSFEGARLPKLVEGLGVIEPLRNLTEFALRPWLHAVDGRFVLVLDAGLFASTGLALPAGVDGDANN